MGLEFLGIFGSVYSFIKDVVCLIKKPIVWFIKLMLVKTGLAFKTYKKEAHQNIMFDNHYINISNECFWDSEDLPLKDKNVKHYVIFGNAAIGKTTHLKRLFLETIDDKKIMPIFVELKNFKTNTDDLKKLICSGINKWDSKFNMGLFELAYKYKHLLILLDGFDEINNDLKSGFLNQLKELFSKNTRHSIVVTSRPSNALNQLTKNATYIKIKTFSTKRATELIKRRKDCSDKEDNQDLLKEFEKNLLDKYIQFASNPLFFKIMYSSYTKYDFCSGYPYQFYSEVYETILTKHDESKSRFERQLKCGLSIDNFKHVFENFCFKSFSSKQTTFTRNDLCGYIDKRSLIFEKTSFIDDLVETFCFLQLDNNDNYSFVYPQLQLYLTAVYLINLDADKLKKESLDLIKSGAIVGSDRDVLLMLFKMNENSCIQNIILPIIYELESEKPFCFDDLFSFYLSLLYNRITISIDESLCSITANCCCNNNTSKSRMVFVLINIANFCCGDKDFHLDCVDKEKLMFEFMQNGKSDLVFDIPQIFEDESSLSILKNIWIGKEIDNLINYQNRLKNKYTII